MGVQALGFFSLPRDIEFSGGLVDSRSLAPLPLSSALAEFCVRLTRFSISLSRTSNILFAIRRCFSRRLLGKLDPFGKEHAHKCAPSAPVPLAGVFHCSTRLQIVQTSGRIGSKRSRVSVLDAGQQKV